MIKFSIIIPCYNAQAHIGRCINSLKQLMDSDYTEFIFIDDGSQDDTLTIIRSFAQSDKRVICVAQSNQGVSAARNAGLKHATGKYVLFLDSDDYLEPNTLHILQPFFVTSADILLPAVQIDSDNTSVCTNEIAEGIYSPTALYKTCKTFPTSPKLVYKRAIIEQYHILFDTTIHVGEVYTFTVQCLRYAQTIMVSNVIFYHYIMHNESAIHAPRPKTDCTIIRAIQSIAHNGQEWMSFPSFQHTIYSLTMCFTYEKYIAQGIINKAAIRLWADVLKELLFQQCMESVRSTSSLPNQRHFIRLIQTLSPQISYICLFFLHKIRKYLHI